MDAEARRPSTSPRQSFANILRGASARVPSVAAAVYDQGARLRSYEMLAELRGVMGRTPALAMP